MLYQTTEAPVRTSFDLTGISTVNRNRYASSNCQLRLNGEGYPVAIRRIMAHQQPGSLAVSRYQIVKPNGTVSLSRSSLQVWDESRAHPVN